MISKKTLLIHFEDPTTDFLKPIYKHKNWTIVTNDRIGKNELTKLLWQHDRIIFMGHGNEHGLFSSNQTRNVINSKLVYILREKECIGIWCFASTFFEKYDLKGFATGMFVSESDEALVYLNGEADSSDIKQSNWLFMLTMQTYYQNDFENPEPLHDYLNKFYNSYLNKVVEYNKNLFKTFN